MFQFLLRATGLVLLAIALVFAILDITRSISASQFVVTALANTIDAMAPGVLSGWREGASSLHPLVWDPVVMTVLTLPTWLVVWFVAMVAMWLGQKTRGRYGRFADR